MVEYTYQRVLTREYLERCIQLWREQMRYRCSHCNEVFEQSTAPKACPLCKGKGKARMRMPAKRLTNKQRRQIGALDPKLVKAFREAQAKAPPGARVDVRVVPESPLFGVSATPSIREYSEHVARNGRSQGKTESSKTLEAYASLIASNGMNGGTFLNTPQELCDAGIISEEQRDKLQDERENETLRQLGPFTLDGAKDVV